jgi:hypothetical protein
MSAPPRKRLKPHDRRAALRAEASAILLDEGIGALTLRHPAQRPGIARGMVVARVERGLGLTLELAADRPEV